MGRRTVAKVIGGDSSPSSAESSFRELDEVFLQTQTRIWLEEVLDTRLDEDIHVSDLLQDGELLFEVSKVVWNLLLKKCMELRHLKGKFRPFGSKKSSGRYRPYSNVDSFLKICKIMGLSDIDLFSPSDVVEKRDIRKVCICIRALSKKARSKQLSVPDFDMVMYSVAMPTDMVGCIRRSLELSQSTLSSSSSHNSSRGSRVKLKPKQLYAPSDIDNDSCSEESDEAESRYMGENCLSYPSKFDDAGVNSLLENSDKVYSAFDLSIKGQTVPEPGIKCQNKDKAKHSFCESSCLSESVKSIYPQNFENDHQLDKISSYDLLSGENIRQGCRNGRVDVSYTNFPVENDDSVVGDSLRINGGESNYISDYLAFSDLMVHANNGSNPVFLDGENNMFDFFLNADSQGLTSDKTSFHNRCGKKFSDDEETEVSSTTSMGSVLGRMLNLEFDDQFDADESVYTLVSMEQEANKEYKDSLVTSETKKPDSFETPLRVGSFNSKEIQCEVAESVKSFPPTQNKCELSDMEFLDFKSFRSGSRNLKNAFCLENSLLVDTDATLTYKDGDRETVDTATFDSDSDLVQHGDNNHISKDFGSTPIDATLTILCKSISVDQSEVCFNRHENVIVRDINSQGTVSDDIGHCIQEDPCNIILENHSCLPIKETKRAKEADHEALYIEHENTLYAAENGSQGKQEHKVDILAEEISNEKTYASQRIPPVKLGQRPLLKTVFKGTAIAGVLFLLLHIRKSRGNNAREIRKYAQAQKFKESKLSSSTKQTGSRMKGVYPGEKINF